MLGSRLNSVTASRSANSFLRTSRYASTSPASRKEGDISSVFVSLSGDNGAPALPERFADVKRKLIQGREDKLKRSWARLLSKLKEEIDTIHVHGSNIIPDIEFKDINRAPDVFQRELRKRGMAVVRGVVSEVEARNYKEEIEAYVQANPWTKAFPQNDPQVFELYWSKPQVRARSHPNVVATLRFLMSFWHSNDPNALIAPTYPLTYADRLRIRQPGDAGFALGPHVDGGSVERWEENGYGLGKGYDKIWQGEWEEYDPWEASCRVSAVTDLYNGPGACSMFRMFQGWLSMSHSEPSEGTLLVNPLVSLTSTYMLLRPFFTPITPPPADSSSRTAFDAFLEPSNWILESPPSTALQGATPGYSQELNQVLHPHLELNKSMVHIPKIAPGDYVAWHSDTVHAVDKVHKGKGDSSVLYIPACPVTESNLNYVQGQKQSFLEGTPPPDFPGGQGEREHAARATESYLRDFAGEEALRSFGFAKWNTKDSTLTQGEREIFEKGNQILGL